MSSGLFTSATPMFRGADTEWLPALGVSWHVPHDPIKEAGRPGTSLIPATPEMVIGLPLKTASPRAMLARRGDCELLQALNKLKIFGLNGAPEGLNPKLGGKESFIPMKNGWAASATGPPETPAELSEPAPKSYACAVRRDVSNVTMSWTCAGVGSAPWACPVVASTACCARSASKICCGVWPAV